MSCFLSIVVPGFCRYEIMSIEYERFGKLALRRLSKSLCSALLRRNQPLFGFHADNKKQIRWSRLSFSGDSDTDGEAKFPSCVSVFRSRIKRPVYMMFSTEKPVTPHVICD